MDSGSHTATKAEPIEQFNPFRQNRVYRLTSVKTDANSLLILNLGNDASQIGKLGAGFLSLPVGPKNPSQSLVNGQRQGCTMFFKTIVIVLVAMLCRYSPR